MSDIFRCALPIQGQNLKLPLDRNRCWQEANLIIASLILKHTSRIYTRSSSAHHAVRKTLIASAQAGENLRLNPHLDYSSDSEDGPLISGNHMDEGTASDKPNYVIIYAEGCFNSKRQARRTVNLYERYKDRVHFVVVDLDRKRSPGQQQLVKRYYRGYIPHVVVIDKSGRAVYNSSGEVDEASLSSILDRALE